MHLSKSRSILIILHTALIYGLAQFIGGLIGAGFLKIVTPDIWYDNCFAANFVHDDLYWTQGFIAEAILTGVLMFVVMAACDSTKSNQTLVPFAIGMTVMIAHMIGMPITGCSINPTRSFASAAAASGLPQCGYVWRDMYIFWLAPLAGSAGGAFLYELVFRGGGGLIGDLIDQFRA